MDPDKFTSAVNDVSAPVQTANASEEIAKLDTDDELEVEIKRALKKDSLEMKNIPISSLNEEKITENPENERNLSFGKAESGQGNSSQVGNIIPDMVMNASTAATPSSFLSIPCRTISQVIFI